MTPKKKDRINLYEILRRRHYDHGVICTYSYDSAFFEDYCLERFNCLADNGNLTVITDDGIYEQAILSSAADKPKQANIRYLLHPVSVPGAFHAKVFLFASKDRGRLIIGSANFTRPGITSNAEMVACYDYEVNKDEFFKPILRSSYAFLTELNERYPSSALGSNLQALSRDVTWLSGEGETPALTNLQFIHNLDVPLWDQVTSGIIAPVDTIFVLSRYFDSNPEVLNKLQAELSPKRIKIFTQNGITTLNRDWLRHPLTRDGTVQILLCTYCDEEHVLPLHAKAVALQVGNECILAFGSANFTTPAMFSSADKSNVETLIVIRGSAEQFDFGTLFDPDRSAVHLTDENLLQSAAGQDEYSATEAYGIRLLEASLTEQRIILTMDKLKNEVYMSLSAVLIFDDDSRRSLAVSKADGNYSALCSGEIIQRLGKSSTVVQVEASWNDGRVVRSNPVLITNLIDIHSGQNLRRERHIREAEQSTAQFFAVLKELINLGEEHDLIVFLSYCDIPVTEATRPVFVRGARPLWDGGMGMRHLGERNLTLFTNLHDAAIHFVDHHLSKLQYHVNYGSIHGIPNFMHILLATGSILRSQFERLVQGFEATHQPLSPHDWFAYRRCIDVYFQKFMDTMNCLCNDYFPRISKDYGLDEVAKRLGDDFSSLNDICQDILDFRTRIESLRVSKLQIMTPSGETVIPRYFECVLNESRWPTIAHKIKAMLGGVSKLIATQK